MRAAAAAFRLGRQRLSVGGHMRTSSAVLRLVVVPATRRSVATTPSHQVSNTVVADEPLPTPAAPPAGPRGRFSRRRRVEAQWLNVLRRGIKGTNDKEQEELEQLQEDQYDEEHDGDEEDDDDAADDEVEEVVTGTPRQQAQARIARSLAVGAVRDAQLRDGPTQVQKEVIPHVNSILALKGTHARNHDKTRTLVQHVIVSARTGTGKTAAFALPILQQLATDLSVGPAPGSIAELAARAREKEDLIREEKGPANADGSNNSKRNGPVLRPRALILCPTRTLVEQVARHTRMMMGRLSDDVRPTLLTMFGGVPESEHIAEIETCAENDDSVILVATPGRLVSLLEQKSLDLRYLDCFVVDECDKMLSMGFVPEVMTIFTNTKRPVELKAPQCQSLLFSATLVPEVEDVCLRLAPKHTLFNLNAALEVSENLDDVQYLVSSPRKKLALLLYLYRRKGKTSLREGTKVIFVRTIQRAERLAEQLREAGIAAAAIHGEQTETQRRELVERLAVEAAKRHPKKATLESGQEQNAQVEQPQESLDDLDGLDDLDLASPSTADGPLTTLVATDVLARGIDIPDLDWIVNYDVPSVAADYIHRVGRTARAGKKGKAMTFVCNSPQLVSIGGNPVQLSERFAMSRVEKLLGRRVRSPKVPGPWTDNLEDAEVEEPYGPLKRAAEAKAKKLAKKMSNIAENPRATRNQKTGTLYQMFGDDARRRGAFLGRLKRNVEKDEKRTPALQRFRDGRYEDVIQTWEKERAHSRGFETTSKRQPHVFRRPAGGKSS